MSLQPPPYTRTTDKLYDELYPRLEELYNRVELPKLQLRRFLIDSVAFAYDVDYEQLNAALSSSELLFSQEDRERMLPIAAVVHDTFGKVQKHQLSTIATHDITLLYEAVIKPANDLGVCPEFVLSLFYHYSQHEGTNRYKAGHYLRRSIIPCFGWYALPQNILAKRIISDDFLVDRIAPNEETRLLLGSAIAKFNDKRWHDERKYKLTRGFYSYPLCTPLHELISKKAISKKAKSKKAKAKQGDILESNRAILG